MPSESEAVQVVDENQAVVELDHAVDILQAGKNSPRIGAIRLVNAIPPLRKKAPAHVNGRNNSPLDAHHATHEGRRTQ